MVVAVEILLQISDQRPSLTSGFDQQNPKF
jgi:hypothetical protein